MNTVEDYLEVWRIPSRIVAALSTGLAALALLLGSIGVCMALGADGSEVMSPVLRQAMRPVLLGGLAGVAGCAAVSRVLSNMLFGVSAYDPIAFTSALFLLLVVALVASYIPARRATRVDPILALRYE